MARNFLEYDYKQNTIIDIFNDHVLKSGDRPFLKKRGAEGWRDLSWKETASQVEAIASYLINSGVKSGAMVSIYSGNRPEWAVADLAALSAACADAAIYPATPSSEAAQIISDTRTAICFCEGSVQADNLLLRKRELPSLKKIVVFDGPEFKDDMVISFAEALREGAAKLQSEEIRERRKSVKGDDLMTVIYTAGTTGSPKGVMLSHSNVMFTLIKYNMRQNLPEGHTVLSLLTLSSAAERIMGHYSTVLDRGIIAYSRGTDFFLQDMAEIRPNFGIYTPHVAENIYNAITGKMRKAPVWRQSLFSRAVELGKQAAPFLMAAKPLPLSLRVKYSLYSRFILSGLKGSTGLSKATGFLVAGAPLMPHIHDFFWGMKIQVRKSYGLTESTTILNTDGDPGVLQVKSGRWITPFPETEMKITVDGEILVKGPQIMLGYLNRPQETQDMFTQDGWFKTDDIGAADIQGYVNITDRKRDIIITSSGKKIAPLLVESAFRSHAMIRQVAVFGEGKKYLGALIVPDFENLKTWASDNGIETSSREELIKNSRVIAKYERIADKLNRRSGFAEPVKKFKLLAQEFRYEEGEITPALKLRRRIIMSRYMKEIDLLFAE